MADSLTGGVRRAEVNQISSHKRIALCGPTLRQAQSVPRA